MSLAARYPPALRIAVLRGIAAQHARGGRALPGHVVRRLQQGSRGGRLRAWKPSGWTCVSAPSRRPRQRRRRTRRSPCSTTRTM
eukprot:9007743-Alexandrium_andersonii.AAC.1